MKYYEVLFWIGYGVFSAAAIIGIWRHENDPIVTLGSIGVAIAIAGIIKIMGEET